MFTLKIKTEESAFKDEFFGNDYFFRQKEVARILRETAEFLEQNAEFGRQVEFKSLLDINGNKVGEFRLK